MKTHSMLKIYATIAALGALVTACSKMDASYKDFLSGGEIRYSIRPDSIKVFPGHNRIKLSWLLLSAPNVVQCKVYWNDRADSVIVPVSPKPDQDTVSVIIDNLAEGAYTFDIYTYDKEGNASITTDTTGNVYGDAYISSLSNRLMNDPVLIGGLPKIEWYKESDSTAIGVELRYKSQDGVLHEISIAPDDSITRINEYPLGDSVQYRTLFLPTPFAIDTFYSAYQTVKLEEAIPAELDKSKFKEFTLPTDAPEYDATNNPMSNLWDGNPDSWFRTANGSGTPHWYTFDLGGTTKLSSYTSWQRGVNVSSEFYLVYANASPRIWEVWGSNDPAPDGSWTGWTKLLECESTKPSGLPLGQTSDEDMQYARNGETFSFSTDTPPVRYIRIKVLQTWDPAAADHSFFGELSFYGVTE